ncbi:hypothetical protein BG003_009710 [Podila horticola]|nr:hypothetical protein BG003_009710 [Podila horticola]
MSVLGTGGILVQPGSIIQPYSIVPQQEWLPPLVAKRRATWKYLQRCFEGGMVVYNTALVSDSDMRSCWTEEKMQRRTLHYFLLGTSLATILEIPSTDDCLKALSIVVEELDYYAASETRSKSIFSRNRRTSDGKTFIEGEYSHLEVRPVPFNMDYVITVATLCEMISQAYEKMALHQQRQQQQRLQQNQHHLGSNHPYNDFPIWNAASLDLFGKIDSRFKKIYMVLYKELEALARDIVLDELNCIDPLGATRTHSDWDV